MDIGKKRFERNLNKYQICVYNKSKRCYEFDTKTLNKPADFPLYIKA